RIIKINQAVDCPGDARQDWRVIQDIAQALGRPAGFTFTQPREIFDELRVASKGGVADYSGVTYEKITQQLGVFWPCYSHDPQTGQPIADHPGTPRLFAPGSYNPVAKGTGPFYFPDGRARFNVADYRPPVDDASEEYPIYLTTGRVVSPFLSGTQPRPPPAGRRCERGFPVLPDHRAFREPVPVRDADATHRPARPPICGAAHRDASTPRREARYSGRGVGDGRDSSRHDHPPCARRDDHPARHDLHPVSLAWPQEREPA